MVESNYMPPQMQHELLSLIRSTVINALRGSVPLAHQNTVQGLLDQERTDQNFHVTFN
jgi:hypothetical protein